MHLNPKNMKIAELLLEKQAVNVSINPPFQWTSGILSPVYCDNRLLIGHVDARKQIVKALVEKIRETGWDPEVIAGTATAAIPWAAFVAAEMDLPMIYVRPEPKKHGAKKQIEGYLKENSRVVIAEDLFSTGGSSIASAAAVENEGRSTVAGVISIMSWELPVAQKNFTDAKLENVSLTGFQELIPLAAEKGYISSEESAKILEFRKDPENWSKNFL